MISVIADGENQSYYMSAQIRAVISVAFLAISSSIAGATLPLSMWNWTYIELDNNHGGASFGLVAADVTGDSYAEVISGKYLYRNPGTNQSGAWSRVTLPRGDVIAAFPVDEDDFPDLVAVNCTGVYWLEATDKQGTTWTERKVNGFSAACAHGIGPQGYCVAQLIPGGKPEVIVETHASVDFFEIPSDPAAQWVHTKIADGATYGVTAGDVDRDGDIDVVFGSGTVWWVENGNNGRSWTKRTAGFVGAAKVLRLADINLDGRLDIVAVQETDPSPIVWLEQPADPRSGTWTSRQIGTGNMHLSMDAADIDGDGDSDVITGEALGEYRVQIWENTNKGTSWTPHLVSQKSNIDRQPHLGCLLADLDNDGDLDIVNNSWFMPQYVWFWRSNAPSRIMRAAPTIKLASLELRERKSRSTSNGRIVPRGTVASFGFLTFRPLSQVLRHGVMKGETSDEK